MLTKNDRQKSVSRFNRRTRWKCFCFLLLVTEIMGCQIGKNRVWRPDLGGYRVVGYVRGQADITKLNPFLLTHINYAFAKLNEEGTLFFRDPESERHLAGLVALKNRNKNLKILLSVGGWGADHFSDAALTGASRRELAQNIVAYITAYQLDGIDLDWEYPGQPGPGIKYREEDKQNFTLLLKTVREHLDALGEQTGRHYLLTIATGANQRYLEHTEMDQAHQYLDFINVMTYDFFSSGSGNTGHHTGLFESEHANPKGRYSANAIDLHLAAGIPASKLVLGVAFYGRGWTGVTPENQGLYQPFERFARAYAYKNLTAEYIDQKGFTRYWDDAASAPYLWSPDSTTFISYEDPESLTQKVAYIKNSGLGGVMFWEYSLDSDGILLDTLVKTIEE